MKRGIITLGLVFLLVASGLAVAGPLDDLMDILGFGQVAMTGMESAVPKTLSADKDIAVISTKGLGTLDRSPSIQKRVEALEKRVKQLEALLEKCGCGKVETQTSIAKEIKLFNEKDDCVYKCKKKLELYSKCKESASYKECRSQREYYDKCAETYQAQAKEERLSMDETAGLVNEKCSFEKKQLDKCILDFCGREFNFDECVAECREETGQEQVPPNDCEEQFKRCRKSCGKDQRGILSRLFSVSPCIEKCKKERDSCLGIITEEVPGNNCRDECNKKAIEACTKVDANDEKILDKECYKEEFTECFRECSGENTKPEENTEPGTDCREKCFYLCSVNCKDMEKCKLMCEEKDWDAGELCTSEGRCLDNCREKCLEDCATSSSGGSGGGKIQPPSSNAIRRKPLQNYETLEVPELLPVDEIDEGYTDQGECILACLKAKDECVKDCETGLSETGDRKRYATCQKNCLEKESLCNIGCALNYA
ncbi:MAG: hypothetical protein U9Q69_05455 [Nanoarchaeota archaeon]|nr:hypothetical protein [Nanoarchaeota archaeon]